MGKADKDELVELIKVQGEMEGKILVGVLESEGIKTLVKADVVHDVLPITVDGLGEVTIYVRRKDVMKAKVVLHEYREQGED